MNFEKSTERVVNVAIRCSGCGHDLVGFGDVKCPRCGKADPARYSRANDGDEERKRIGAGVWVGVFLVLMLIGMLVGAILY